MRRPDPDLEALILFWRKLGHPDSPFLIASISNGVPFDSDPAQSPALFVHTGREDGYTSRAPTANQALVELWPDIQPNLSSALDPYLALLAVLAGMMTIRPTDASVGYRTGPHFVLRLQWGTHSEAPHEVSCDISLDNLRRPYANSPTSIGFPATFSATTTTASVALWEAIEQVKLRLADGLLLEKTGFSLEWSEAGRPCTHSAELTRR